MISFPGIQFDRLHSFEVLDHAGPSAVREVDLDGSLVRVGPVSDVTFIPELHLQLVDTEGVPMEAVMHQWNLIFELQRDFQGRASTYREPFAVEVDQRDVCILSNLFSRNFFHWTTEELVKVQALECAGFRGDYVLDGLPEFAFEFMALLGVPRSRMIVALDGPIRFRAAWFVTPVHSGVARNHAGVYRHLARSLRVAARGEHTTGLPDRIWMERGLGVRNHGRELVNGGELLPILERHGFSVVDMAALPVRDQVATAAAARVLSGPHGGAFAHVLMMPAGGSVIECFSPLFVNPGIYGLCHVFNHRYWQTTAENAWDGYPHGQRPMVDPELLELVLRQLPDR